MRLTKPPVELLLEIDEDYRSALLSRSGIWLPVLHTERSGWTFTVMHGGDDRVVIVYGGGQRETVRTQDTAPLEGQRVVVGREPECVDFYREIA
ncbi:MAG: hypothetical protein GYB64_19340 [Chloroflexi bacterium]|nr:hypothetical protein [Chloroflexota bacterium]